MEDESKVLNKVIVQEEEVQPPTVHYTPPHLRKNGIIRNNQNEQPMISLVTITGRVEPRTLKFKGSINSKNITILVDSGSTQFRGYQSCKTTKSFCIHCEGSHGYNC
jgi:hypothetical protein